MKKYCLSIFTVIIALFMFSCASIQKDILYTSLFEQESPDLKAIETDIIKLRANDKSIDINTVQKRLEALAASPSSDAIRSARVFSLQAYIEFLSDRKRNAIKLVEKANRAYKGDEIAAVVESLCAKTNDEKLKKLKDSLLVNENSACLKAELGSTYFALQQYGDALAAFDFALPKLGPEYSALFLKERDHAYALRNTKDVSGKLNAKLLKSESITLINMIELTQETTNLLDKITGDVAWSSSSLFDKLSSSNWFIIQNSKPDSITMRKDAAKFLWGIMTYGNSAMNSKYTTKYSARGTSPIPDVPYVSPFFDAILGVVEEDIIPLVDGKNFAPDATVSALDFYTWLNKVKIFK